MQVFCSNCNTAHEVTRQQAQNSESSVIHCTRCEKRIKLQFCPHCGSFYSITFSNIKSGRYKYRCSRCMKDFAIEFPDDAGNPGFAPQAVKPAARPDQAPVQPAEEPRPPRTTVAAPAEKIEVANFINNSINSFSINELFEAAAGAFTLKKLAVSSAGVTVMLLLLWIFDRAGTILSGGAFTINQFTGSFLALFPLAIIFSLYTATAALVSRLTLDRIFSGNDTEAADFMKFSLKNAPAVFAGNVVLLLAVSGLLMLFGRIPLLGPVIFSLVFLPVYLISILIFLFCFIGLWFYPPIAAHREKGIRGSIMGLLVFIKKHNLSLLYMIPVILLVSIIVFSALFIIHTSAFSLTISLSKWLVSSDAGGVFSSIPASFVKASEATIAGAGSGLFRQLSANLGMTQHFGGFILGISMTVITVALLSVAVSVTATISSHIYIVMERGLTIDDRKKGAVFLILTLMLAVILLVKKLI